MRIFSKLISHIFNPLFFPLAGSILYFFITPKFNPPEAKRLILLAILVYHEHINGAVVFFLITTIPLIAFPFLWTLSIYRRQEKKRQDVMKGKWK